MRTLVYLMGHATDALMAELLRGLPVLATKNAPFGHRVYPNVVSLQDALLGPRSMTRAIPWLHVQCVPLVLGEGARLARPTFFDAACRFGYLLHVIYVAPESKGCRISRALDKLGALYGAQKLDGTRPPEELADMLRRRPELRLPRVAIPAIY